MLIFVAPEDAPRALQVVRQSRYGEAARIIGEVKPGPPGRVQVRTLLGTARLLDPPLGELLPRICLPGYAKGSLRAPFRILQTQLISGNRPGDFRKSLLFAAWLR